MQIKSILKVIEEAASIVLLTHQNPDIDGLSSMLAFTLAFPKKDFIPLIESIPYQARFLHGFEGLIPCENIKEPVKSDLVILFDASCEKRIDGRVREKILPPKRVLVFDHHQREVCDNLFKAKTSWIVNSKEASTSVLLYRFFKRAKINISERMAENLLAGIYYDTGGFRHENVKGDIFKIAHELVTLGARPSYIAQALFDNIPLPQVEFMKLVLERIEFLREGSIALSYLTWEDFRRLGGEKALNDLAGFLRQIEGVTLSALVKEVERGLIKVSLRSKAPFEAINIAKIYGGGGHRYACGFQIQGASLQEFLKEFKKQLEKSL